MQLPACACGALSSSVVEPRDVFREATLGGAAAIVVFHNHPSGDPTPSPEDVDLTRRLAAGRLKMTDLFDDLRVRVVTVEELGAFGDPHRLLANVNTPADHRELDAFQGHQP